jgi:hypothetical protein
MTTKLIITIPFLVSLLRVGLILFLVVVLRNANSNVNRRTTKGRPQNTIKNSMNNMIIQDLNNMVDLMKKLMLWKSSRTSILVQKKGLSDATRVAVVSTFICFL